MDVFLSPNIIVTDNVSLCTRKRFYHKQHHHLACWSCQWEHSSMFGSVSADGCCEPKGKSAITQPSFTHFWVNVDGLALSTDL